MDLVWRDQYRHAINCFLYLPDTHTHTCLLRVHVNFSCPCLIVQPRTMASLPFSIVFVLFSPLYSVVLNSTWSSLQHVLVFRIEQVLHVLAFPSVDSRLLFLGTSKSQTQQPLQALVQRSTRPCGSGWPDGKPEAYYTAPSKLCVHDGLAGLHQFRSGDFMQPLHTTIQQHVLFTIYYIHRHYTRAACLKFMFPLQLFALLQTDIFVLWTSCRR